MVNPCFFLPGFYDVLFLFFGYDGTMKIILPGLTYSLKYNYVIECVV